MALNIKHVKGKIKNDSFGYATAVGDFDGDGEFEIAVAAIQGINGGSVAIYSGTNRKLKKRLTFSKKKISSIRLISEDINQDKADELIIAITYQDLTGEVKVYTLKQHKVIHHWKSEENYDAFGFSVASGDVDGDGIPDVIIGAPQPIEDGKGKVYAYSGKDGSLIRQFTSRVPRGGSDFATSLAVGDINGDGINEVIVGAPGVPRGEVFVFSAKHGWLVHHLTGETGFGVNVHVDDVIGNGYQQLLVTTKELEGNVISIYDHRFYPLYDIVSEDIDIGFGEIIATSDINGDGRNEIIVGAFDAHHRRKKFAGQINIYSGDDGALIHRWYGKEAKEQFGFSLATGNLSSTNKDHIIIGAPSDLAGKEGKVYIVSIDD